MTYISKARSYTGNESDFALLITLAQTTLHGQMNVIDTTCLFCIVSYCIVFIKNLTNNQ